MKLYPRHEKRTKKPAETTGNRYEIEIFDESDAEIEGIVRCFAQIKNIKRQSLLIQKYVKFTKVTLIFQDSMTDITGGLRWYISF